MSPVRLTHATSLILQALASGRRHGFQIMEVTGLASGTVYPVLRRLEKEAMVDSRWEDEEAARDAGRRRRRIYHLTASGQLLAEKARQRLARTQRVLADEGLGPVGASEAGEA
ncbi:MAG: PadR family transcriptional regulator [Longimicrobiales bacterium]|nr:PadR family transcriptional regulator [Longimicrobiales bacterium]